MSTKVRLAARVSIPEDTDAMAKEGWDDVKTATPDPKDKSEKNLINDGKRATDEPAEAKVVADQSEPVTSASKESDRVIRREEIIENDGQAATAVKERGPEEEEAEEEEAEENRDPFHQTSSSAAVLAALKLAELEEELGLDATLWEGQDKFARIASLETQGVESLRTQINAYKQVKTAGLAKPTKKSKASLPPLGGTKRVAKTSSEDLSDFAVFL